MNSSILYAVHNFTVNPYISFFLPTLSSFFKYTNFKTA
ncbi:hypothetical protein C1A50_2331 [Paenibacillus polymyxa]|nr:hypothetical protein C1A50_2331 [Paenibacillus polymyxa]